jgi:hypothetical protein
MAEQSYANHAHRPTLAGVAGLFTFIAIILLARFAYLQPSWIAFGLLSLSCAVLTLVLISRSYTTKLQDRIIRLEMHGRLARLGHDRDFSRLTTPQIVALRFASDAELPALCDRTLAENLSVDQIKRGVTNWQADLHRT